MIRNVLFDWSGTLSDDFMQGYTATMNVLKRLGAQPMSPDEYKTEFTLPYMNFYKKFTSESEETIRKLFLEEIVLVEDPKPFPGIGEVLEYLSEQGIRLAIISSHPQEKLEQEVESYGFSPLFLEVSGSIHDKTRAIIAIMGKRNFLQGQTMYVGDMTHDMDAGKEAAVTTVAVSWGYQPKEKLAGRSPDFIIDSPAEIKKIILLHESDPTG